MKAINLIRGIFIILMVICISGISSYAIKPAVASAIHLQKVIKENVRYPEQAVKKCCTGSVDVIFTLDEEGKIKVEKTFAENAEIEQMVKEQLSAICCKGIDAPFNQHYKVRITFKLVG
ncbi:MAG: hypothetical protein NT040_19495 [Bacteroidetes bacterium]|nr:hypothetical protein [Bacteroidota bacterium]